MLFYFVDRVKMSQVKTSKLCYKMFNVGRNFGNIRNKCSLLKLSVLVYLVVYILELYI